MPCRTVLVVVQTLEEYQQPQFKRFAALEHEMVQYIVKLFKGPLNSCLGAWVSNGKSIKSIYQEYPKLEARTRLSIARYQPSKQGLMW
jgi:hypothetical protein